jgi:carboxylesterase type B
MNFAEAVTVIVDASCGKLEGARRDGISTFKGIPFATTQRERWQE